MLIQALILFFNFHCCSENSAYNVQSRSFTTKDYPLNPKQIEADKIQEISKQNDTQHQNLVKNTSDNQKNIDFQNFQAQNSTNICSNYINFDSDSLPSNLDKSSENEKLNQQENPNVTSFYFTHNSEPLNRQNTKNIYRNLIPASRKYPKFYHSYLHSIYEHRNQNHDISLPNESDNDIDSINYVTRDKIMSYKEYENFYKGNSCDELNKFSPYEINNMKKQCADQKRRQIQRFSSKSKRERNKCLLQIAEDVEFAREEKTNEKFYEIPIETQKKSESLEFERKNAVKISKEEVENDLSDEIQVITEANILQNAVYLNDIIKNIENLEIELEKILKRTNYFKQTLIKITTKTEIMDENKNLHPIKTKKSINTIPEEDLITKNSNDTPEQKKSPEIQDDRFHNSLDIKTPITSKNLTEKEAFDNSETTMKLHQPEFVTSVNNGKTKKMKNKSVKNKSENNCVVS